MVYSNVQNDTTNLISAHNSHYSTLLFSLGNPGEDSSQEVDATCPRRAVITVSVPDSVHYVCWNGQCVCNCAVKGAGVNIHFTTPQAGEMEMLSAAGFGYTRMDFNWEAIEQTKGKYNWAIYDVLVNSLAPFNVTPYFIFDYSNPFYDNGTSPVNSEGDIAFANFAVNSTLHYAGKGFIWELYNEPNIGFWKPTPNVTQYIALGLQVGSQLKKTTPQEIFVGPAVANTGATATGLDVAFVTACFQAGLLEYWDAMSFHAYRQTNPETVEDEFRLLRQLISMYMPSSKNFVGLISGEWGYSTSWAQIDNNTQGEYIVREMLFNLANEVPISIWYDWHDDGTDPTNAEHNFGTTFNPYYPNRNPCYDPKPSYISRKTMQSQLAGKHFNKRIWVANPDIYVMLFNTAGAEDYVIAAWTSNPTQNSTIQIPSTTSSTFRIVTMYGTNTYTAMAVNGYLTVTVTTGPQYITATSSNALLSVIGATTRVLPAYAVPYGWFPLTWTVPNPTSLSLSVSLNGSAAQVLSPGDTALFTQNVFVTRQSTFTDQVFTITTSLGSFNFYTSFGSSEPLSLTILPASGNIITAILSNPAGTPFQGYAEFETSGAHGKFNLTSKFSMTQGQTSVSLQFQVLAGNITGYYSVTIQIFDSENADVLATTNSFEMMDDYSRFTQGSTPKGFTVVNDGDPKVPANYSLIAFTPPGGPVDIATFALHFSMGAGWKFLWIMPSENTAIADLPVSMGCWVYGASQQDYLRLRVVDATGQTFQLTYGQLNFNGWQYLSAPFTPDAYWGGANDGQFHLPLKVVASFLLDSTQQANSGVVYFSPPILVF